VASSGNRPRQAICRDLAIGPARKPDCIFAEHLRESSRSLCRRPGTTRNATAAMQSVQQALLIGAAAGIAASLGLGLVVYFIARRIKSWLAAKEHRRQQCPPT
jgi:hypothetical protein